MRTMFATAAGIGFALVAAAALAAGERSDRMILGNALTKPAAARSPTPLQRALLAEKIAISNRLMQAALDGREVSADYRMWLMESMFRLPLAELRAIGTPSSHDSLSGALMKAAKAPAKLGSLTSELVYYPITPCRYIDTRSVGGPLTGTPRPYDLAALGNTYGGSMACNPKAAVGGDEDLIGALSINVTIVSPTVAPGFVGARPAGGSVSTSLVNWYQAGATVQAANAGIVTTDQTGAVNEIEFFGSPTQFLVDVFGVFAAPNATALECTNGTETNVVVNTTTRDFNLLANVCPAGYAMLSNSCQASGDYQNGAVVLSGGGAGVGGSNCFGTYTGGTSATIFNAPWCCRIPGR